MSERAPIFLTEPLVWGWGTAGDALVLEATGVTLDGTPILRLVSGTPAGADALIDDASGEILIDGVAGEVLYEG